jgi:hypothetical protein
VTKVLDSKNGTRSESRFSRWIASWKFGVRLAYDPNAPDAAFIDGAHIDIEVVANQVNENLADIVRQPTQREDEARLPELIEEAIDRELRQADRCSGLARAAANIAAITAQVAQRAAREKQRGGGGSFAGEVHNAVTAVRNYWLEQRQAIRKPPFLVHAAAAAASALVPAANLGGRIGQPEAAAGTAMAAVGGAAAWIILRQWSHNNRMMAEARAAIRHLAASLETLSHEQEERFRRRAGRRRARKARLHAAKWQRRLERVIIAINAQVDAAEEATAPPAGEQTLATLWNVRPVISRQLRETWQHQAAESAVTALQHGGDLRMPVVDAVPAWPVVPARSFENTLIEIAAPLPMPLLYRLSGISTAREYAALALERLPLTAEQDLAFRGAWIANNAPHVRGEALLEQSHHSRPGITVSRFVFGIPTAAIRTALREVPA